MQRDKRKNKKWMKFRHRVITSLVRAVLYPYARLKFGVAIERFKEQGDRQYLIVMNHQTVFDQFFVGMAFRGPIYYVATEDIFSKGWVSALIRWVVAPIPIKKQTTDVRAVMNCRKVVKEGGTIALAPEGNRTYSGRTEYMNPAISRLARVLGLPLAIFRIEGGYGVQPRWSDTVRRGKMRAYVSQVIEPSEYDAMTDDELLAVIREGLYVNEASVSGAFRHKKLAEYLERAMYVCPKCGLSVFESHDDIIECKKCGMKIRYLETKELEGVGCEFPFRFVAEWYDYQCSFVNKLDTRQYIAEPLYRDKASLSEVIVYKNKKIICEDAAIALYGDRIVVGDSRRVFMFDDISVVAVLGRNKANIYHSSGVYQLKGSKRFNALKYVNIFYRSRNIARGDENGEFLGL